MIDVERCAGRRSTREEPPFFLWGREVRPSGKCLRLRPKEDRSGTTPHYAIHSFMVDLDPEDFDEESTIEICCYDERQGLVFVESFEIRMTPGLRRSDFEPLAIDAGPGNV